MKIAEKIFKRKGYKKTSPFGMRFHPIKKRLIMHNGTDYGTQGEKWEQYALEIGKVLKVGFDSEMGNYANVYYPRIDLELNHRHLDQIMVAKDQVLNESSLIGLTGTTGSSSGIHLHLGVKYKGRWIDPESVIYKPMEINGIWDEGFTRLLQFKFKTSIDSVMSGQRIVYDHIKIMRKGLFGSQLIKAMQRWLGVVVDGQFSESFVKALQTRFGTVCDGRISLYSMLVVEMKKRINEEWL